MNYKKVCQKIKLKKTLAWQIVPKPRSAIKTIERLSSIIKLEGKEWDKKDDDDNHPVRREYLKMAYPYDKLKDSDPEINARMDFARFQTLGLAYIEKKENDKEPRLVITKACKELDASENKEELLLRQLLKWQFPSNIHSKSRYEDMRIFPLEIILKVLSKYNVVNRLEVGFSIFSCTDISQIKEVYYRIEKFRKLTKRKPAREHRKIFIKNFFKYNGDTGAKPETYLGNYDDVLFRHLEFTGLFETSGRGDFTKLYIPEIAKIKFKQLVKNYKFNFFENYRDLNNFYSYFGNPYSIILPWETEEALKEIVEDKVKFFVKKKQKIKIKDIKKIKREELKEYDEQLSNEMLNYNEQQFVNILSKTKPERIKILEKFYEINNGDEDLAALWLEVNTWKSLVAMKGKHFVKRNFRLEADLTPRSFAGGRGNTPDMEFYNKKYIIIPEVSIQSGVQQWITEGSSVVDHVYKFSEVKNGNKFHGIENVEKYINTENIEAIYGFFLCRKINERLLWQFFVLCREAWRGEPISIVPMEIPDYVRILQFMYKHDISALSFEKLIEVLAHSAKNVDTYPEWSEQINTTIDKFTSKQLEYVE